MKKAILVLSVVALIMGSCKEKADKPTVVNGVDSLKNDSVAQESYEQFDNLYRTSPLLYLPLEYSGGWKGSPIDSIKFIETPESLFAAFKLDDEMYEKRLLMAKLPEYKNIKVIIIGADTKSGATEYFLYTLLNNKLIDNLYIYGEGEVEYNGRTESISLTSFTIANNYDIQIKNSLIPKPMDRDKEINVERETYIINEDGKFVKKADSLKNDSVALESHDNTPADEEYAAGTSKDSVFVSVQETDFSDIYTLYHRTDNSLRKIYEINTEDGSSIGYEYRYKDNILDYDCIYLDNNACDCIQYIFFDRQTKIFYATKNFFQDFSIEKQSINFKDKTLILYSDENTKDITDISSSDRKVFRRIYGGKRVLEGIFIFPIGKKDLEGTFIHQNK